MPMLTSNRRRMLQASAATVLAGVTTRWARAAAPTKRLFTMSLRGGSIGVNTDQPEAIRLAARHGFEAVTPDPHALANASVDQRAEWIDQMKESGLVWGAAGLPVEFRRDEATFREQLNSLPDLAAAMQDAGVTRVGTYLMPCHDDLTYTQNMRQHAERLRQCVQVLGDHGQRFGMEYVGPKTLWTSKRYPFIHSMAETKDLIAQIDQPGVGFILDSWHWYTAGETVADITSLSNADVVACDLNDAPAGLAVDQQIDNQRMLPMATGVIDLKSFLQSLVAIGYDGPIRAEPFNRKLAAMENGPACAATAKAMTAAFDLIDG
ncbi:Inosose isomerase [Rubripirellula lacrimiformis]|uniref:Inosose isomerase n=1 Tax=Rubripirellula lacrimiformis TaxID=1930273 RepID=A0A517NL45_9BACT|nr:sugar phosphate isomerase/epimerase family protein [Rubripirellula lacrimiformis]QDT07865.1 Inosose isomerase [Rubripirellula lacrimiformis]